MHKRTISAEIIADSIQPQDHRLTSFIATFPRSILAEVNTHRAFSRNSASSRAIPFPKMVEAVQEDAFIPIAWMKDHRGMQGTEILKDKVSIQRRVDQWLYARDLAVLAAKKLYEPLTEYEQGQDGAAFWEDEESITKQNCNRILEPYMWHTALITASEFENFFALRVHPAAEIHLQDLAGKMLTAYNTNTPKPLVYGEWHIPFGDEIDKEAVMNLAKAKGWGFDEDSWQTYQHGIATARCARLSYMTFENEINYMADLKLSGDLEKAGHWSPFEHTAQAVYNEAFNPKRSTGNFKGWMQLRQIFPNENKPDPRVIRKTYEESLKLFGNV